MRKVLVFLTLAVLVTVVSCVKDGGLFPGEKETTYTVKEARAFFEEFVGGTRSSGDERALFGFGLSPDWRAAKGSNNDELFSIDVPAISPGRVVIAWRGDCRYYVHVAQKLVMVKRGCDGQQGAYLLTLIPEQSYSPWHEQMDAMSFVNTGCKSGYSGLAVYTLAASERIMRVDRYVGGVKVEGHGMFG
ncbi:MAG: hypothetical protein FWE10_07030, partial [Rikenellaceae bacterium]|nr:hypothetical protein [Rikenellaceae bacterium]MCL2693400.1 hypothetical protein [Rikenellaceae bacterium]